MSNFLSKKAFYKKAYLLEFWKGKLLQDAFCFSVPPEEEEIAFAYRVKQTKTFGGICIDNYGEDSYKISLSGSTINQESKFIYRSGKLAPKYLSGEEEIFYLQKLLSKYSETAKTSNAELVLYDLSKNKIFHASSNYVKSCYTVYPTDFKIKRSKNNPMTYNYSIEFIAIDRAAKINKFQNVYNFFVKATEKINTGLDKISAILSTCQDYVESVYDIGQQIIECGKSLLEYISLYQNILDSVVDEAEFLSKQICEVGDIYKETEKIITDEFIFTNKSGPVAIMSRLETLVTLTKNIENAWTTGITSSNQNSNNSNSSNTESVNKINSEKQELAENLSIDEQELDSIMKSSFADALNQFYLALMFMQRNDAIPIIMKEDDSENDVITVAYGYTEKEWTSDSSLESLCVEKYGSADYVYMLMRFNNIAKEEDLTPGTKLYLPNLTKDEDYGKNEIYSQIEKIYGVDIKVGNDGSIGIFNGDIQIASGTENLSQAIETRLTTLAGSRVKDMALGINSAIGDIDVASNYIIASIIDTLRQEPRIESIDNISFEGQGDNLIITVNYTDISGKRNTQKTSI